MKMPGRRGLIVAGLTAMTAISAGLAHRLLGRKRLRFPYLCNPLPADQYQVLANKPGWQASQILVAPGISLNGLVRRPQNTQAPWVLFYQGNDANMLRVGQRFLADLAADRDWGLAIFAYRGYDSSGGEPYLVDLAADAPEIITQLCKIENISPSRLHVVGFSIGGHLAVRAMAVAGQRPERPKSLALLAPVNDIVMVRRSLFERLDAGDDFQTSPYLDAIPAPVLVVQGTADEALLGPDQGRAIAAKLGNRAEYVELSGVGHIVLMSNDAALGRVRDFIASKV